MPITTTCRKKRSQLEGFIATDIIHARNYGNISDREVRIADIMIMTTVTADNASKVSLSLALVCL